MFGYASIADLAGYLRANFHVIPKEVDLVVGIPRSGMIPAYLIGLYMNRAVVDLETFLADGSFSNGFTRSVGVALERLMAAKHVLLVDDSASSGNSMNRAVERISEKGFEGKVSRCVVFAVPSAVRDVDIFFKEMPHPHIFEWNAFHDPCVENSCFDFDGVLCANPSAYDDDDGPRYREFLINARPLFKPTYRVGYIVSSRLEKYRALTEEWLAANGISYGALHLLNLASRDEKIKLDVHCYQKARVYKETQATLFYESEPEEACEIARLSGKPVLCVKNMQLYLPEAFATPQTFLKHTAYYLAYPFGHIRSLAKRWLPPRVKNFLKKILFRTP